MDKFIDGAEQPAVGQEGALGLSRTRCAAGWRKRGTIPRYGARPLARVIQTEIKNGLSDEILFGGLQKGGEVALDLADDKITFRFD